MRLLRSRARLIAAALAASAIVAVPASRLAAAQATQDKPPSSASPLINGVWQLNQPASSTEADLGGAGQSGDSTGGSGRGGRRGGGTSFRGVAGMSPEQMAKLRALIQDVTTMPQRLTMNLAGTDVTLTFDSGQVLHYSTTGKEEKQDFTNGSAKVKTTWDGAVLTQHIAVSDTAKFIGTFAVSGDQLVVSFTRDAGTPAPPGPSTRPAAERRWVYDAVK